MDSKASPAPSTNLSETEKGRTTTLENKPEVPLYNADVDTSGVDEKKLMRKLDYRIVPWLSLLYLLSFLDRTSIGNAKVRGGFILNARKDWWRVPQTPLGVGEAGQQVGSYGPPIQTPYKPRVRRIPSTSSSAQSSGSAAYQMSPENTPTRYSTVVGRGPPPAVPPRVQSLGQSPAGSPHISRTATPNLDFAGMQAEIDHAHDKAAVAARETLLQIFPGTDLEVVEWVLEANEGDLGKSIEALLEMSSGT